ncbi:g5558 [Coccomyxa elongata]
MSHWGGQRPLKHRADKAQTAHIGAGCRRDAYVPGLELLEQPTDQQVLLLRAHTMNGTAGLYIVFVVLVATFFNLMFLMLTLRVVCTRMWRRGQAQEASEAQCPECPNLQRVTPVVVVHPDSEVVFGLKLVESLPPEQQSNGEGKGGQTKAAGQGSERQLSFWVASVPQHSAPAQLQA